MRSPPGLNKFLFILLSLLTPACFGQAYQGLRTELLYNDNLTRSEHASDAREDLSATLAADIGMHLQPWLFTGLDVNAGLKRSQYRRYGGLSNTELGLAASLSHKFGIGERVPVLNLSAGVARNEFNVDMRDAWIYSASATVDRRLHDSFSVRASLAYERRDGDHDVPKQPTPGVAPRPGNAWDIKAWSIELGAELELGPASWLSGSYRFLDGDVVSTGLSYPRIVTTATAITLDPLFGPHAIAYRVPALTHSLVLDLNKAVLGAGTLYLGLEYQVTRGRNGIDYDTGLLRSGFIYGF